MSECSGGERSIFPDFFVIGDDDESEKLKRVSERRSRRASLLKPKQRSSSRPARKGLTLALARPRLGSPPPPPVARGRRWMECKCNNSNCRCGLKMPKVGIFHLGAGQGEKDGARGDPNEVESKERAE